MIRATADASCGASAGLPGSTVWSSTIPFVAGDLGFVAEFDRFTEAALGDRARMRIVQADPPSGAVGICQTRSRSPTPARPASQR
jgi:hypothetical protein